MPTLILDDGTPLAESLLIVMWLERTRPAPALFDETPVGQRRRRTMAEGMARLEAIAARKPMWTQGAMSLALRDRPAVAETMPR